METSLLRDIDCSRPVPRRYDLGMSEFVDSSAFCDPHTGKENRALSLSLKKKRKSPTSPKRCVLGPVADNTGNCSSRFDFRTSYSGMAVKFVPKNTRKKMIGPTTT